MSKFQHGRGRVSGIVGMVALGALSAGKALAQTVMDGATSGAITAAGADAVVTIEEGGVQ